MKALILGANSEIARNFSEILAEKEHAELLLGSRNEEDLDRTARHLRLKYGIKSHWLKFDATDYQTHKGFFEKTLEILGELDLILIAFGYLGDNEKGIFHFDEARRVFEINFLGAVSILSHAVPYFMERKSGTIIGISSVAGDRGRRSNFIYGSAKSAFSEYLSGLRAYLFQYGVHVMTVKPGPTRTPMTEEMDIKSSLLADPYKVALDIYRAYKKKKPVIYTPRKWKFIMGIIKHIPESIFRRLNV